MDTYLSRTDRVLECNIEITDNTLAVHRFLERLEPSRSVHAKQYSHLQGCQCGDKKEHSITQHIKHCKSSSNATLAHSTIPLQRWSIRNALMETISEENTNSHMALLSLDRVTIGSPEWKATR